MGPAKINNEKGSLRLRIVKTLTSTFSIPERGPQNAFYTLESYREPPLADLRVSPAKSFDSIIVRQRPCLEMDDEQKDSSDRAMGKCAENGKNNNTNSSPDYIGLACQ
jgi:hypothetical protein